MQGPVISTMQKTQTQSLNQVKNGIYCVKQNVNLAIFDE